jgi:sarcosine oxidase gamma subunit
MVSFVEEHWAREVAEETIRSISNAMADGAQWLVVSERECREQFEKLSLLWVRNHLPGRMLIAALRHTKLVIEPAAPQAMVSSAMESVLGHSPDETFWVDVVGEQFTEFQKLEELFSWL